MNKHIGKLAFLGGIGIAIITGFPVAIHADYILLTLGVLGIIVGFLNIEERETTDFLIATVTLLVAQVGGAPFFQTIPYIGDFFVKALSNIAVFVTPAAILVALKSVVSLARD